ncbi:MAG TPA: hypothetical protein VFF30_19380 [Nitrososphaerales archaeon]|nr:hypothetical protein [Nitrososphaerales archaeon]
MTLVVSVIGILLILSIALNVALLSSTTLGRQVSEVTQTKTSTQISTLTQVNMVTSTTFLTKSISSSVTASSSSIYKGLELEITLDSASVSVGDTIGIQVALVNTLNQNLTLPLNWSADSNITSWELRDYLCGGSFVEHTFGYAIFQGHYTNNNISKAGVPLSLVPPAALSCFNPFYDQAYIQNMSMLPTSHVAIFSANSSFINDFPTRTVNMLINAETEHCATIPYSENGSSYSNGTTTTFSGTSLSFACGYGTRLNGYWEIPENGTYFIPDSTSNKTMLNGMNTLYRNYFHLLPLGQYTVVAQDIWNQTVCAYFRVTPQLAPVTVVSVMSSIPAVSNPTGPNLGITLTNTAGSPIVSLNASLQLQSQNTYPFIFDLNSSNPLLPGQSLQSYRTLVSAEFDSSQMYPLTLSGVFQNGTDFSFMQQVMISNIS